MILFLKNIKYLFTHDLSKPKGRISKSYLQMILNDKKDFTAGGIVEGRPTTNLPKTFKR